MIAIDTNLLVYAHRSASPAHGAARRLLERAALQRGGWGFTHSTVSEFWRTVTDRSIPGGATSAEAASRFITSLVDRAGAEVWQPGPRFALRLMQLATEKRVVGLRVYDLQIALTAWDNGATELWTSDRNFASVPGLRVRDPFATAR